MPLDIQSTNGGQYRQTFAGGNVTGSNTTAAGGRLNKVIIAASGTAAVTIYDGTNQTAGSVLYTINATAASSSAPSPIDLQVPIVTGIFVLGTTGSPALVLSYEAAGPNGRIANTAN